MSIHVQNFECHNFMVPPLYIYLKQNNIPAFLGLCNYLQIRYKTDNLVFEQFEEL